MKFGVTFGGLQFAFIVMTCFGQDDKNMYPHTVSKLTPKRKLKQKWLTITMQMQGKRKTKMGLKFSTKI